jgi:acid phosphatase type 7
MLNTPGTSSSRIFALCCFLFCLAAQTALATTARYRAMWRQDPAHTMTIGWHQVSGTNARIVYDLYDHGDNASAYRFQQPPDRVVYARGMQTCFARLQQLQPNTTYYFLVIDSEGQSQRFSFQTTPDNPRSRLSIVAGGDSRNYREARRSANALVAKLRPHFVLFAGDMTNDDSPRAWIEWLDDWQLTTTADGRLTPVVVARGNHEIDNQGLFDLFDLPNENCFYSLEFGGSLLKVLVLNTEIPATGPQALWLDQTLAQSRRFRYRFAMYHQSMQPHTFQKTPRTDLIGAWATLFDEHGVEVVLESDAHVVKTTWPIRPDRGAGSGAGFIRDDRRGTVYLGEGCWGAPLRENNADKSWTRNSGRFNQFKWVFVDESRIEIRTIRIENSAAATALAASNPFAIPRNLDIWQPSNGGVVTIFPRYGGGQPAPKPAPTQPSPAVRQPSLSAPSPGIRTIVCNAAGRLEFEYRLPQPGDVEFLLVDQDMRLIFKDVKAGQGPGPYSRSANLSNLSKGRYKLIIKLNGTVLTKYAVIR